MKVSASVKLRGKKSQRGRSINGDQLVRRKGRLYVINKRIPKHKQRQG